MKKSKSGSKEEKGRDSPSDLIDARIKKLGDWRGETLARVRILIKQADPEVVEEVKWRKPSNSMLGVPVWEHDGIICTGETYKAVVKMTFARGASLKDPSGLFNSSLEGNTRRAIDFHEGDKIDERALKALIRAAVALNTSVRAAAGPVRSQKKPKSAGGQARNIDSKRPLIGFDYCSFVVQQGVLRHNPLDSRRAEPPRDRHDVPQLDMASIIFASPAALRLRGRSQ